MKPNSLLIELYETDETGKPKPLFEIKHGPPPKRAPLVLHHALHAIPALEAIDKRIDEILSSLGKRGQNVAELMDEVEALQIHGCKLFAQTIYLDTSDRNSWLSINQCMTHQPRSNSVYGSHAKNLKAFWKGSLHPASPSVEPAVSL
ncbi:hypothetical protein RBE51_22295 [Pseudomonas taiwanensis]|uniref:hypothetical protein n=1 Tax=Pseudomonas taiwanensis TaxID=470150 RepID=UPI0028DE089A|nr:hypothetical protein [Pseudomonas taiwanensis]MDT8925518.1 hypothetical protein [Pseudomonas taiwanensis]